MIKKLLMLLVCSIVLTTIIYAQESNLAVDEMVFCSAIEERQPVASDTVFANTVENVYCFTKISGSENNQSIFHVWYYKDEQKARVELSLGSKTWRTWSSKKIVAEWTGKWVVNVESANGAILSSKEFLIKSP